MQKQKQTCTICGASPTSDTCTQCKEKQIHDTGLNNDTLGGVED